MANGLSRALPKRLEKLPEVAYDLRLASSMTLQRVWRRIDPEAWEATANPCMILQHATRERLEEAAADEELISRLEQRLARQHALAEAAGWFGGLPQRELAGVAYFSMEFGLSEALPTYSGGLGILAGDHLKSASDLHVPVVGIGLLYQQGYFRQVLAEDGRQLEALPFNDPSSLPVTPVLDAEGRWPRVRLELPGRTLLLRVWRARVGKVSLYLLDSNHPLNAPWDRGITSSLYSAAKETRLLQELVLGVGGWRLLEKLGIEVDVCHLNEGHAAFAVLARAASFAERHGVPFAVALRATRAGNVFTTHTPVEAAFDRFEPALVTKFAGPFIRECRLSEDEFVALGRCDPGGPFNMAYLAMRGSCQANGVARLHGRVSRHLFQVLFPQWPEAEVPVDHVTNGVDVATWRSEPANDLWGKALGDDAWVTRLDEAAKAVARVPDEELWDHRALARQTLVQYVRRRFEKNVRARNAPEEVVRSARHVLDPNRLTLGFARRFTGYKRPNLLLHDEARLVRLLCDPARPVQLLVAGKAHPRDDDGKAMIQQMVRFSWREDVRDRVVFLEDYDMTLAQHMAAGVDVWINNPRRPLEACGTSGMKILSNGGLHCSTLDGWWDEAYSPEVGWAIGDAREHDGQLDGDDARALYDLIERKIAPEFYGRDAQGIPRAWVKRVRASMTELTPIFSAHRMVKQYVERAYLPAARAYHRRAADGAALARELEEWVTRLGEAWYSLRFGDLKAVAAEGGLRFEVQAFLGELSPETVSVELYADPLAGQDHLRETLTREAPIHGTVNGHVYRASISTTRPASHFTPRFVPRHPEAFVPAEASHILWRKG